jgi:hypothetical protein
VTFKISNRAVAPSNSKAPPLPPVPRQAVNYVKAQVVAAQRALSGEPVFKSEEEAMRIVEQTCKECPKYRWADGKCSVCGCPCFKRAEREGLGCPIGKFG